MAGDTPQEWFQSLPPITRGYLVLALLTTICMKFDFVDMLQLHFYYKLVWEKFQVWRLFTNFIFFGDFSFGYVMQLYILVQYTRGLEMNPFPSGGGAREGTLGDFTYMMLFGATIMLIISAVFGTTPASPIGTRYPFMGPSMVFMFLYVWSKRNPEVQTGFFGFRFKGIYLPWVLLVFHVLVGADIDKDLIGIAAGHLYYFLLEELPYTATMFEGKHPLTTPRWWSNLVDGPPTGPGAPAPAPAWGAGRPLGAG